MRITKIGIPPGGNTDQILIKTSDSDYDVEWADNSSTGGSPGGSNTQVQFNDGGNFGGDAGLTYDKVNDRLTTGSLLLNTIVNATTDTDKFLVSDGGVLKYRTGSEILSDIGGVSTSRTLTINGTSYDLSANRTWSVGTVTSITAGSGLDGGTITSSGTISHSDTSTQASVDNSNGNVIQDVTLDTYGHVTALGSVDLDGRYYTETEINNLLTSYVPTSRTITINGTSFDLSANRTYSVGTVTSVGITAGTGISVSGSPITGSGSITVTNSAPDQTVSLTQGGTTTITGTYPNFTISSADQYVGTVTSVGGTGTVNGITLTGSITSSGNLTLGGTLSGVSLTSQVSGTLPISNGGTGATSFTQGSVIFAGASSLTQDNANFFWDDTNNRLGIGNANPVAKLHISNSSSGIIFSEDGTAATVVGTNAAGSASQGLFLRGFPLTFTGNGGGSAAQMTLDSSGNLGLGVTPSAWGTNDKAIDIGGSNSSTFSGLNVTSVSKNTYFDGTNWKYTQSSVHSSLYQQSYLGNHVWYLGSTGSAGNNISWTQAMTLFSTGNLAINSGTDAGYKLDVNGTGRFSGRTKIGGGYIVDELSGGNNTGISFGASAIFSTNGSATATAKDLGSSTYPWGNIFGGAATFSSSVTAVGGVTIGSLSSGSDAVLTLATNASGSPRSISYKAATADITINSTSGSSLMNIKNGGQIQLNSYTSSSSFTGTAAGYLAFDSSGNILTTGNPASGYVTGSGTAGSLDFLPVWTTSSNLGDSPIYVDSAGDVGMQTEFDVLTANARFTVDDTFCITERNSTSTNSLYTTLQTTARLTTGTHAIGFGNLINLNSSLGNLGYLATIVTDATVGAYKTDMILAVNNASGTSLEKFRVKSNGQLQANQYTTTTSFNATTLVGYLGFDANGNILTSAGSGVTQSETTWTPAFSNSGATIVYATNGQVGYYVKTGSMVVCTFRLSLAAGTSMTGNTLTITGLPFTSQNATNREYTCDISWASSSTNFVNVQGRIAANTTTLTLWKTTAAGTSSQTAMVGSDITTGSIIQGTITYFT